MCLIISRAWKCLKLCFWHTVYYGGFSIPNLDKGS